MIHLEQSCVGKDELLSSSAAACAMCPMFGWEASQMIDRQWHVKVGHTTDDDDDDYYYIIVRARQNRFRCKSFWQLWSCGGAK